MKVDIVTSDDIKINYTGKFSEFTARYIIKGFLVMPITVSHTRVSLRSQCRMTFAFFFPTCE